MALSVPAYDEMSNSWLLKTIDYRIESHSIAMLVDVANQSARVLSYHDLTWGCTGHLIWNPAELPASEHHGHWLITAAQTIQQLLFCAEFVERQFLRVGLKLRKAHVRRIPNPVVQKLS